MSKNKTDDVVSVYTTYHSERRYVSRHGKKGTTGWDLACTGHDDYDEALVCMEEHRSAMLGSTQGMRDVDPALRMIVKMLGEETVRLETSQALMSTSACPRSRTPSKGSAVLDRAPS